MDRITPVRMPGAAARSEMEEAMRQAGMPRACPASRRLWGTSRSISWVVMTTTGIMMKARAIDPEKAEKWCMGRTTTW